jgi:anti-sigma regulatory factor (Ser/Thr protein kinase)
LFEGLERLRRVAVAAPRHLDGLCDHIVASLVGDHVSDDVAVLAMRLEALAGRPLHVRAPAEPNALALLRHALRRWLRDSGIEDPVAYQILVASGEACANAVQHAYGAGRGWVEVDLGLVDADIRLTVRDSGTWRTTSPGGGGRGLDLMRGLMDSVEVETGEGGTVVTMRVGRDGSPPSRTGAP